MNKLKNPGRWGRGISFAGLSALLLLAFQNCDSGLTTGGGEDHLTSLAQEQGFVYDTVFDQLAYMSCSEVGNQLGFDSSTYFTLRLGAYGESAGIRLESSFMELTEKSSATERLDLLNIGPGSKAMQLQLALRPTNNLQSVFVTGGGSGSETEDYNTMFTILGEDYPSASLLASYDQKVRIRYLRNNLGTGVRVEGDVRFQGAETLASQVREFLTNTGVLAVSYRDSVKGGTAAIAPQDLYPNSYLETRDRSIYGKAYQISFKKPLGAGSSIPSRVLASVQERSLENASDTSSRKEWTCHSSLVFKVVLPEDAEGQNCRMIADDLSQVNQSRLELIRRSLRPEDWFVDLANNCVVPKKFTDGACYGKTSSETIQYDISQECDPAVGNVSPLCAHYVSICIR